MSKEINVEKEKKNEKKDLLGQYPNWQLLEQFLLKDLVLIICQYVSYSLLPSEMSNNSWCKSNLISCVQTDIFNKEDWCTGNKLMGFCEGLLDFPNLERIVFNDHASFDYQTKENQILQHYPETKVTRIECKDYIALWFLRCFPKIKSLYLTIVYYTYFYDDKINFSCISKFCPLLTTLELQFDKFLSFRNIKQYILSVLKEELKNLPLLSNLWLYTKHATRLKTDEDISTCLGFIPNVVVTRLKH
jgi:hypothetical protein